MLYVGLAVGVVLGSFMTIIVLALFKEVSVEQELGVSPYQVIKHGSDRIKREAPLNSATIPFT